jgi:uncharacterized protein (TIGR03435 family)
MRPVALALLCSATLLAQPAQLTFDVVSIRRNLSERDGGGGGPLPGGAYTLTNVRAKSLIGIAYDMPQNRILGGPGWLDTDRYDLTARGKDGPTRDEARQMLRAVLRDRFQLLAHVEQRDLPIYTLAVARPDRRLGPRLRPSAIDCLNPEARQKAYAAAAPGSRLVCGLQEEPGTFTAGGTEISALVIILAGAAGRPVFDKTGLAGGFDIDLKWTPALGTDALAADAVSIFTAVQEQLGLRLENGSAPLDVLVIDRIDRPTEN